MRERLGNGERGRAFTRYPLHASATVGALQVVPTCVGKGFESSTPNLRLGHVHENGSKFSHVHVRLQCQGALGCEAS